MISPAVERIHPAIGLNGSGKKNLHFHAKERYLAAKQLHAVAIETAPHPRDFQGLPDGEWVKAREQHEADMELIYEVVQRFASDYHWIAVQKDEFGR